MCKRTLSSILITVRILLSIFVLINLDYTCVNQSSIICDVLNQLFQAESSYDIVREDSLQPHRTPRITGKGRGGLTLVVRLPDRRSAPDGSSRSKKKVLWKGF